MFSKQYGYRHPNVTEGGNSRLNAILELCKESGTKQILYRPSNNVFRAFFCAHFVVSLLRCSEEVILLHYSIFASLFSKRLVTNRLLSLLLRLVFDRVERKNQLFVEVNDLPYEQSIDLELPPNRMYIIDRWIFKLKFTKYIFASVGMVDYVSNTYGTPRDRCSVLINGGPASKKVPSKPHDPNCLKFVYAGTLNPGRQIENMIRSFKGSRHTLYLLGENGNWILNSSFPDINVKYLGALDEAQAHKFVGTCDIGLIPYDQTRPYYNMCYPTKASFYITAGIPFLSTELEELQLHFNGSLAIFCKLDDWAQLFESTDFLPSVAALKSRVVGVSHEFQWRNLWQRWLSGLVRDHELIARPSAFRDGDER